MDCETRTLYVCRIKGSVLNSLKVTQIEKRLKNAREQNT